MTSENNKYLKLFHFPAYSFNPIILKIFYLLSIRYCCLILSETVCFASSGADLIHSQHYCILFTRTSLNQHRQIHSGKQFKCEELNCLFAGRSRADLRAHLLIHGEDRPFQCGHCPFSTKTKAQLVRWVSRMGG